MKRLFKKLWNWIVSVPQDKLLHYIFGEIINLFSLVIFVHFMPLWAAFLAADAFAIAFLVGKEIYDSKHSEEGHSVELNDILAGLFGILTINLAMLLLFL
jgi:hypothetical protein